MAGNKDFGSASMTLSASLSKLRPGFCKRTEADEILKVLLAIK